MSPQLLDVLHALPTLFLLALAPLSLMALWYWQGWRLDQVGARPFPEAYRRILLRSVPLYRQLTPPLARQLRRLILQFLYQKKFVGCAGLEIDDEIRVTIAAGACLLRLNRKGALYPNLSTVLVYPGLFVKPQTVQEEGGIVTVKSASLAGESWSDGRVILAWDHVRDGFAGAGHNVVIHEFAHQLDSEGGVTNGAPVLQSGAAYQRWSSVMQKEFAQLQYAAEWQLDSVIDVYGAQDPAEFFACASESFFMQPAALQAQHPELYRELAQYYRVDPLSWQ